MGRPGVKICGITRREDAVMAVELGADLVGLNFHRPSPRHVEPAVARRLADAVRGRALVVGVFVDAGLEEMRRIDAAVGLDLFQLHGDEPPELVAALGERALKAFRVAGDLGPDPLAPYPDAWGFLFDRHDPRLYGGSGESWDWAAVAGLADPRPRLVAGGVRPGTARRALAASGAWGVDVCSGVEREPGIKDRRLVEELLREVRDAA